MTGLPNVDAFADYGGPLKNSGPIDPWTESAEQRNLYAANVAAMTHTIARAFRSFLGPTAGQIAISDPPTGLAHDAVWLSTASGMKPIVTGITGSYAFDVFWPTTVTDHLGNKRLLKLEHAEATVESSGGTYYKAQARVIGNRKVRVYTFSSANNLSAPVSLTGEVVTVWVR